MDGMDITTPYFRSLNRKQIQGFLTLDNIFKYASEDELRAIVSSIIGRLNEMPNCYCSNCNLYYTYSITDKDLDIFVKELRDVK